MSGLPRAPQPPPPPVPAVKSDTIPVAGEVTIRTMRDDIADVKSGRTLPEASREAAAVTVAPTTVTATSPTTSQRHVFPLPPRETTGKQKVVLAPAAVRRKSRSSLVILGSVVFVLVLLGVGVGAWLLMQPSTTVLPGATSDRAAAADVIPAEYQMLVQYRLLTAQDRTDIEKVWQSRSSTPTLRDVLGGNPRPLLTDPEVTEIYYVVLQDSGTPYLLVPVTTSTTELLVTRGEARTIEKNGWYIAHQVASEPYSQALASNTLSAIGAPPLLADTTVGATMRLFLGAGSLPLLRNNVASEHFLAGQLQELQLALRPHVRGNALEMAGRAVTFNRLSTTTTNQQLLSLVPAQAMLARLGTNFTEDVAAWRSVAGVLDEASLGAPVVTRQLEQLTGPYAYFTFPNTDGSHAHGLIIELPVALRDTLTLDAPALVQGLPALIPLILDRRTVAPIAFTEVPYGGSALRFANIAGTSQALDYAVTSTHLLIATSKDSMLALLDTVAGTQPSLETAGSWQNLLADWGALPSMHDLILGQVSLPALQALLPLAEATPATFGLLVQSDPVQTKVSGLIEIATGTSPAQITTSPFASPVPLGTP